MKHRNIEIDGTKYTVKEIRVGDIIPILPQLQGDKSAEAQLDIVRKCVFVEGVALGEKTEELALSAYMKLAELVMKVNGLGEEGNG